MARRSFTRTPEMLQMVRDRFPTEGPAKLAKDIGVGTTTICRWAKEIHVRMLNPEINRSDAKLDRSHVDHTFFESWTIPSAYYLGYIWGDGSIQIGRHSGLHLECKDTDRSVLEDLQMYLKSHHALSTRTRQDKRGFTTTSVHVGIWSRRLTDVLEKHGLRPNKSRLDLPYPEIPLEFHSHFVRGFFDADGTVYLPNTYCNLRFLGTKQFIHGLTTKLIAEARVKSNAPYERTDSKNLWQVGWSSHSDLLKLYSFLYPPGSYPFLARKRERLSEWLTSRVLTT